MLRCVTSRRLSPLLLVLLGPRCCVLLLLLPNRLLGLPTVTDLLCKVLSVVVRCRNCSLQRSRHFEIYRLLFMLFNLSRRLSVVLGGGC